MFDSPESNDIENWVCIKEAGKDYEIELAKNLLADYEIPASIISKRDSSFSLNIGDTALVYLYVPRDFEEEAREVLAESEINKDFDNEEE